MLGHRQYIGGLWEEMGKLQFDFLIAEGLQPDHYFCDIACGSLRAGVRFITFMQAGHYLGIEKEESLVRSGIEKEMGSELNQSKRPQFVISGQFEFEKFAHRPHFALAQSLFTHLPPRHIDLCMDKLRQFLRADGAFYATFYESGTEIENPEEPHDHGHFAYTKDQMVDFGSRNGWSSEYIGHWNHPRGQVMVRYRPQSRELGS